MTDQQTVRDYVVKCVEDWLNTEGRPENIKAKVFKLLDVSSESMMRMAVGFKKGSFGDNWELSGEGALQREIRNRAEASATEILNSLFGPIDIPDDIRDKLCQEFQDDLEREVENQLRTYVKTRATEIAKEIAEKALDSPISIVDWRLATSKP